MSAPAATMRTALRHGQFRRLLAALAVSQAGDWLYNLALVALVYDRTRSATWVAVTTAARVVPVLLLGPFGGLVADRFDRRTVMVVSDVARGACMLGLALVAASGLPIALAPVLAALATAAGAPYPSAVAVTTPRLVPADVVPGANAARSAVTAVSIVAGPGLGALLLLLGSTTAAFVANAGTFALSALLVLSLPGGPLFAPDRQARQVSSVWSDLREGAAALRGQPDAVRLIGADVLCSFVYGAYTVLLILLARRLGAGDAGYGYLLAATGLGAVLGTALAGRAAATLRSHRVLVVAAGAVAVPALLLALASQLWVALVLTAVIGGASIVVEVCSETALQRSLAPEVLGRAYGLAYPAAVSGIVVGSLVAAPLEGLLGLTGALLAVGAVMAAYVLVLVASGMRRAATAAPTAPASPAHSG